MLSLQNISFAYAGGEALFEHIHLYLDHQKKAGLIGNNGSGKSTLLKLIAGQLQPTEGVVSWDGIPHYIPQVAGQFDHLTVADALGVAEKINALHQILNGKVTEENMDRLNDEWDIEERSKASLNYWQIAAITLDRNMASLSGGEKTKAFLAGISIHQPKLVLLDEPGNHLDSDGRKLLAGFLEQYRNTILLVSHDRSLLEQMDITFELGRHTFKTYGGNYSFYREQKIIERDALQAKLDNTAASLRKAKEQERISAERRQKQDARGKHKQEKAGTATIMMNTLRNNAEKSTARQKGILSGKTSAIHEELKELREQIPDADQMKVIWNHSVLHKGKILLKATAIQHTFDERKVWRQPLSFEIRRGDRLRITGANGSGKTTLLQVLQQIITPDAGVVDVVAKNILYIDQDYALLQKEKKVFEQTLFYNDAALEPHEVRSCLARFLFKPEDLDKKCGQLSGGEKLRLLLCCLSLKQSAPDIIILDEPTNNLDIRNVEILTASIAAYDGTLIVVSHDAVFVEDIALEKTMML